MEYSVDKLESDNIDDLNDETFGDGAITGDWESAHFSATAEMTLVQALPEDGLTHKPGHIRTLEEVEHEQEMTSVEQKIKGLWPSSPQLADSTGSIWSSPKLPSRLDDAKISSVLPGKIISLEELEREMTESSPSLGTPSLSPAHQSQATLSPSSLSPAHVTPSPIHVTPSPTHVTPPPSHVTPPPQGHVAPFPGQLPPHPIHAMAPPGSVSAQRPPSQMPHPHFLRGGMQQFPWLMRGNYMHPPPGGLPHIPPPKIPILGPRVRVVGPFPSPPQAPPTGPPPLIPGPPPGHPLFFQHQPQEPLRKSKRSEYLDEMKADGSGFMTQKEKEWVIRIQLVQLQSQDPDNEDYYYQNYKKRQAQRLHQSQLPLEGESPNHDSPNSSPSSKPRPLPTITHKEYKPKEFQGALGKLTVSSIAAPRKMIDIPVGSEGGGKESEGVAKDSHKKRRQALIVIEKLYDSVLLLEELDRKSQLTESSDSEEKAELVERKNVIVDKAYSLLRLKAAGESNTRSDSALLQLIMTYCKGKRVISRILPFLQDEQAFAVVQGIMWHLPAIVKRDATDLVLPELTTSVMSVVSHLSLSLLLTCLSVLMETLTSASYILRVCHNEFGGRVLKCILEQGHKRAESCADEDDPCAEEWSALVKQLHSLLGPHEEKLLSKSPIAGINLVQFIASLT